MASVITSYSIHYTKLYEDPAAERPTFAGETSGGGHAFEVRENVGEAIRAQRHEASRPVEQSGDRLLHLGEGYGANVAVVLCEDQIRVGAAELLLTDA